MQNSFASKESLKHLKQRVFLLTDGSVGSPQSVIDFVGKNSNTTRVFTFGIGSGCDTYLVNEAAKMGRGTSTIVGDGAKNLNGLVIKALSHAMEPSLKGAMYGFNGSMSNPEELYRNTPIVATLLTTQKEFQKICFEFRTTAAEDDNRAVNLKLKANDFAEVTD